MKKRFCVFLFLLIFSSTVFAETMAFLPFTGECAKDNDRNLLAITIAKEFESSGSIEMVPFGKVKGCIQEMEWMDPEKDYSIEILNQIASSTGADVLLWGNMNRFGYFPFGDMTKYQYNVQCQAFNRNQQKIIYSEKTRDQNINVWTLRKDQIFKQKEELFKKVGRGFKKFFNEK